MKVGIIGAGAAGVNAAQVVAQADIDVTLFSAEKVLPYFRPHLPDLAFGDEEPENIFMHELDWYAENGIDLRLNSKIKAFTQELEVFPENGGREKFDALIIATGGEPVIPPFVRESTAETIFPLWDYSDALKIRERVKSSKKVAIIGGGIIGIESALRANDNGLRVTVIEKKEHLLWQNFSEKASEELETLLRDSDIDLVLDDSIRAIEDSYDNLTMIVMEHEMGIFCDFVVLALGISFDTSSADRAGLKTCFGILVDEHLQTSSPGIFAAGNIAQLPQLSACSVKEALLEGRMAGHNVLAYLKGDPLEKYEVQPVSLRLKYKGFEFISTEQSAEIHDKEDVLGPEIFESYRRSIHENSALVGGQTAEVDKLLMKCNKASWLEKILRKIKSR